jgi:hypothetical protein
VPDYESTSGLDSGPFTPDKWVLSSALQKLIRRGRRDQAVAIGFRLHRLDPAYLRRRLPIIAVEDIGIADLMVCRDVMSICSASLWWRDDAGQTIARLISSLAGAVKSRAACDALCLSEVHEETPAMLAKLLPAGPEWLADMVADVGRPRLERMNALRVLGGITIREGVRYRTLSRCNSVALDRVASKLGLPPLVRWLMACNAKSGHLAAMLPIAVEAAGDTAVLGGGDFPHSLDVVEGIPLCAVDMFSELGRGALRELLLSSAALGGFVERHVRGRGALRLVNMALFHAESSILDRYLSSAGLDALTEATESEEMRHLGMVDPQRRGELREILRAEAGRLAQIRTRRLAAMHGPGEASKTHAGAGNA